MHSNKQIKDSNGSATPYFQFVQQKFKPGKMILGELNIQKAELLHAALGVCGEAGELGDALKKFCLYGKELDRKNVIEELGDLRFFMQAIQNVLLIGDDEIIQYNVDKLNGRYKKGYTNEEAIKRADKQEITEQCNKLESEQQ